MSKQLPAPKESISQLIFPLKSSFRLSDFERVIQTLNARDEAATRDISYWKTQYEAMEKKHGVEALEKLIALDELRNLRRERDLLKDQVATLENGKRLLVDRMEEEQNSRISKSKEEQKAGRGREGNLEERYAKLWEDFSKVEAEKAKLGRKVSALEFEKEKAEREAEECKRQFEQLGRRMLGFEDTALLTSEGPAVKEEERSNVAADEVVMDEKEGGSGVGDGSGNENLAVSVAGSRVIIEIDNSDDEMPTGKRGLSNDDFEDVEPAKKRYTKSVVELLDMPPDSSDSFDTEDSSSSGSEIDSKSEIARLCRKVAEYKTWACTQELVLVKYLTGGNPQVKQKRSASELQEFDRNGIDDCIKLALRYTDRLFEIYQNKLDAFFLPS